MRAGQHKLHRTPYSKSKLLQLFIITVSVSLPVFDVFACSCLRHVYFVDEDVVWV